MSIHRNYAERTFISQPFDGSYVTLVEMARSNIMYPLLCNNVVAEETFSFFSLWSWRVHCFISPDAVVDQCWYPQAASTVTLCMSVCQCPHQDDKLSAVFWLPRATPCLTESQWSRMPTCRRTCSRTPLSVPHRLWRSTTLRKTLLHTLKRYIYIKALSIMKHPTSKQTNPHETVFNLLNIPIYLNRFLKILSCYWHCDQGWI